MYYVLTNLNSSSAGDFKAKSAEEILTNIILKNNNFFWEEAQDTSGFIIDFDKMLAYTKDVAQYLTQPKVIVLKTRNLKRVNIDFVNVNYDIVLKLYKQHNSSLKKPKRLMNFLKRFIK